MTISTNTSRILLTILVSGIALFVLLRTSEESSHNAPDANNSSRSNQSIRDPHSVPLHSSKIPRSVPNKIPADQPKKPFSNGFVPVDVYSNLEWLTPESLKESKKEQILDKIHRSIAEHESTNTVPTKLARPFGKKRTIKSRDEAIDRLKEGMNFRAGVNLRAAIETAQYYIFFTPPHGTLSFDSGCVIRKQNAEIFVWRLDDASHIGQADSTPGN